MLMGNIERKILQLKQDEGTIVDEANLKVLITENTNKFGAPALNYFAIDIQQLPADKSYILTSDFSEKEVFKPIPDIE